MENIVAENEWLDDMERQNFEQNKLKECIQRLTERARRILDFRYREGQSSKVIANHMDMKASAWTWR